MKPTSLLLSTALASLIVLAPATLTSADAAGIKIKPQVVKVKPKIAVAKPKLRVKVKAARVRVTPNLRVKMKPKIAVAKPKLRVKVKPKIKAANIKPRIKPQALAKAIAKVKPVAVIEPQVKVASTPPKAAIKQTGAATAVARVAIPSGISDAAQGARAAAAARDALKVGAIGVKVTGKLGSELVALDIASPTVRTNTEIMKGMFKQPKGEGGGAPGPDGKWDGGGLGRINADNFVGLPGSHSSAGTDPNTAAGGAMAYWSGKREGDIAGAIAGVAGQTVRLPIDNFKNTRGDTVRVYSSANSDDTLAITTVVKTRADGSATSVSTAYSSSERGGQVDRVSEDVHETDSNGRTTESTYRERPDLVERRDPESAGGGSTPFPWINEREKGTFDFSKVGSGGKSPGAMPQAPHGEDGTPRTQRVVSQNDLLERYDEENRGGGAPTPIDPDGVNRY